jgi:6-pyruvoyltetrahydropterin/6-carboxytetrahydropterin synthase
MPFRSTKTYTHAIGLSACFRQWRAKSHCRFLHGYALQIRLEFEADRLDDNGWVVDFGSLKPLRARLEEHFDHRLLVAADDPELPWLREAHRRGIADIVVVDAVGCERFAEIVYRIATGWLYEQGSGSPPRCRVALVEVAEHGGNSAIYTPE